MLGHAALTVVSARGCASSPVRTLLWKEAGVLVKGDGGWTTLHATAQGGHAATGKMLVNAGADQEATTSAGGNTPLHLVDRGW